MSIENKLSTLTTIPEKAFDKVKKYLYYIHSNDIVTSMKAGEDVYSVDIFEGTINIVVEDDVIKYRFVPNKKFADTVCKTIMTKESGLVEEVTEKLKKSLINTYKDIL